jgi:hypothetical protein
LTPLVAGGEAVLFGRRRKARLVEQDAAYRLFSKIRLPSSVTADLFPLASGAYASCPQVVHKFANKICGQVANNPTTTPRAFPARTAIRFRYLPIK